MAVIPDLFEEKEQKSRVIPDLFEKEKPSSLVIPDLFEPIAEPRIAPVREQPTVERVTAFQDKLLARPEEDLVGLPSPQETESKIKDIWDAFNIGSRRIWHKSKQFFVSALPTKVFPEIKYERMPNMPGFVGSRDKGIRMIGGEWRPSKVMPEKAAQREQAFNKRMRDTFKKKYLRADQQYKDWVTAHPELRPRKGWEGGVIENIKKNPKILLDPGYWGYIAADSVSFSIGVMGTTLGVAALTGNPVAGLVAGVAVATPMQTQDLYEDLIANGATETQAADLSILIGPIIASVEAAGNLPLLRAISKPFTKILSKNISKQVAKQTTRSLAKRGLKTFTAIEVAETLEEITQKAIQDATVKTVNENRSILEGMGETAVRTLIATAPLALLGVGGEAMRVARERKPIVEKPVEEVVEPAEPAPVVPPTPPVEKVEKKPPVKKKAITILPRKEELLGEIETAIEKAPDKAFPEFAPREPSQEAPKAEWEEYRKELAEWKAITSELGTVSFQIDGGAKIINVKSALREFQARVKKLPTKMPAERKEPAKRLPKPIVAKTEKIVQEEARPLRVGAGYFSDGIILIKGVAPKARHGISELKKQDIDKILSEPTDEAELEHYVAFDPSGDKAISDRPLPQTGENVPMVVFKSKNGSFAFDQFRYNAIRNRFPTATYGISGEKPDAGGLLIAYEGKTSVAALMGMKGREQEVLEVEKELRPKIEKPTEELPSEFVPTGLEPKTIEAVVIDTFRDWPKQITKVGQDYWVEVMAVAKELSTPYKYKALRQTTLGVFAGAKGVLLQDVRDTLTATHEVGHNLDWLINNKSFPSSIKLRFPDTTVGENTLRAELKAISKILRPDLWEGASGYRLQYLNRHVELMADFFSHYILDPEATRRLAPNMTEALEAKIAEKPEILDAITRLQESRYAGPEEPVVAKHIREDFPLPKEFKPLQLAIDLMDEGYVKAAENLGIAAARNYKALMHRARTQAARVNNLVPNKDRQIDLVVIAENAEKNPWTGKTREEIVKGGLSGDERSVLKLYRGYMELARQTVNKYLRGADIAEYIKFLEDYFIHAYETPMTEKYRNAISKWAKRSPQARKRILPDLNTAVELGLSPKAKTLSEGLQLWAAMNYRVATNKAFLRILPKITNDDGVSILQKPQDFPAWPTVDYWPIRQTYKVPLPGGRGILLFQGRVAVDPKVKPFIDAMFSTKAFSSTVRVIEGMNAVWKAFELTLFSFFHHQAEFFSAIGALGPRALPFVGGFYGARAQAFGKRRRLLGFLPARIGVLEAGRELEKVPEFMDDYISAGGQIGYITTEGINLMERMLREVEDYLKNIVYTKPIAGKLVWPSFMGAKGTRVAYSWMQHLLWDNVQRVKLVTYYNIVADGAKKSDLPIKDVKEIAAKYVADNYGGQEWLNTAFRNPKTRQFWTQLMMSLDWTFSQIKTGTWPFRYKGATRQERARRALMRKIGRHHWFWYLSGVASFTIAGSMAMNGGKGPWENEPGHKFDIDWTNVWRNLPWNKNWEKEGDYSRRYIALGKAGRELARWVTDGLRAFGYKLSPVARTMFEQGTGYNIGSSFPEPWAREDLELYEEVTQRFKHLMLNFQPYAFSGNNAFLAFPSRKGMTRWKAIKAYEEIYRVKANIATGGLTAKLTKVSHLLDTNEEKLMRQIAEACKINQVDSEKARRAALSGVRSKYYRLFWRAAIKQDAEKSNRYADALIALGITNRAIRRSQKFRADQLSKEAGRFGVRAFRGRSRVR